MEGHSSRRGDPGQREGCCQATHQGPDRPVVSCRSCRRSSAQDHEQDCPAEENEKDYGADDSDPPHVLHRLSHAWRLAIRLPVRTKWPLRRIERRLRSVIHASGCGAGPLGRPGLRWEHRLAAPTPPFHPAMIYVGGQSEPQNQEDRTDPHGLRRRTLAPTRSAQKQT